MSAESQPVIAVVPHYNDAEALPNVVRQLGEQNYSGIYVLDDASPQRDEFEEVAASFKGDEVTFIRGEQNLGSAGNRNRIIGVEKIKNYGDAILHFVDADVTILTDRNPEVISDVLEDESIGMVGGLLREEDGQQSPFNYGPAFTLASHIGGALQVRVDQLYKQDKVNEARKLRNSAKSFLDAYPDITSYPKAKDVFWVVESNLAVPADVFESAGGFPSIRYHEIQGLSLELEEAGLRRRFDPRFAVSHSESLNPMRRPLDQITANLHLIGRYGIKRFMVGQYESQLTAES